MRFCTGFRVRFEGGGAIERRAAGCCDLDSCLIMDGSSRYRCCGGGGVEDLDMREGFLLGMGGGAGLRRTWGLVLLLLEPWFGGNVLEAR